MSIQADSINRSGVIEDLSRSIDDALSLLQKGGFLTETCHQSTKCSLIGLVDECKALSSQPDSTEEPIRTIHHFACSGGTLFSKCVASMPNVRLFSEVDPLSTMTVRTERPLFLPTDMIMQARQSTRGTDTNELIQIFQASIDILHKNTTCIGCRTVLRDHAHSQFCTNQDYATRPTLLELLKLEFSTLPILTIRDPVESFISLRQHNWVHFGPNTFDEYCKRYIDFMERYENIPVFKYEDLVTRPKLEMQKICDYLRIPYQVDFEEFFSIHKISGDSGRGADRMTERAWRTPDDALQNEIDKSVNYPYLLRKMGYPSRQRCTII